MLAAFLMFTSDYISAYILTEPCWKRLYLMCEKFWKYKKVFFFSLQIFIKVTADGEAANNATTPGKYHQHWYCPWPFPGIEFLTLWPVSWTSLTPVFIMLLLLWSHLCSSNISWTCPVLTCAVVHHLSVLTPQFMCVCVYVCVYISPVCSRL